MGEFVFEVRDALVLDELDVEITLIGPVVDPGGRCLWVMRSQCL